jgi:hypothetical protein
MELTEISETASSSASNLSHSPWANPETNKYKKIFQFVNNGKFVIRGLEYAKHKDPSQQLAAMNTSSALLSLRAT